MPETALCPVIRGKYGAICRCKAVRMRDILIYTYFAPMHNLSGGWPSTAFQSSGWIPIASLSRNAGNTPTECSIPRR